MVAMPPDTAPGPGPKGAKTPPDHDETPVLPVRSQDDTDAGWGERPEPDDDERLYRDRPPHWDSA
jgi:hypothetical protein